jgi:hypothetical protein
MRSELPCAGKNNYPHFSREGALPHLDCELSTAPHLAITVFAAFVTLALLEGEAILDRAV